MSTAAAATLAERIDALLPQTQCTKCGFAGCRPYAEAIAAGDAGIERCPPGGNAGAQRLASLLGREPVAPDPARGVPGVERVAVIDETRCIGCTLCIQACPVDAIVGAARRMHTVLDEQCTGCERCVAPCPVDCIAMVSLEDARARGHAVAERPETHWEARARYWRGRFEARRERLVRERLEREQRLAAKAAHKLATLPSDDPAAARKRAVVEAALARARARRQSQPGDQR
jgi:electron transport complex protein RnfB